MFYKLTEGTVCARYIKFNGAQIDPDGNESRDNICIPESECGINIGGAYGKYIVCLSDLFGTESSVTTTG